jgi:hypothetical protein
MQALNIVHASCFLSLSNPTSQRTQYRLISSSETASEEIYVNDVLVNGFDYQNQAWVENGLYVRCAHPNHIECRCYGRMHEGEASLATFTTDKRAFFSCSSHVSREVR